MPPRGRGGKFSKPTRGGGKHFSRDLQPLDKDGNPVGMWRDPQEKSLAEESEEESSEESSEEESDTGAAGPSNVPQPGQELSREQRKEEARKKKLAAIAKKNLKIAEPGDLPTSSSEEDDDDDDEDEDMPANPNHSTKARAQARVATAPSGETPAPATSRKEKDNLSRREREAIEKEAARERYQKLHAEGKTDEAKADLARLRIIRQQREEAAARKKAEADERAEEIAKKQTEIEEREAKLRAAAMGDAAPKPGKKTRGKK